MIVGGDKEMLEGIRDCVNACAGLNPEGIKPLAEAVERLRGGQKGKVMIPAV